MNINTRTKSILIASAVVATMVSFGLITFAPPELWTNSYKSPLSAPFSSPDSVVPAKKPSPDSLFNLTMKEYERLFQERKYELCLTELKTAAKIKPTDQSVKEKIARINVLITEQKQKQQDAARALASGDTYFNAKDYLNAKASYQMAVGLTPDDPAAKEKLNKTMSLLRSQKATNTLYDVAVASADKLYQQKEYERAKSEYENALKFLPGEAYARNKINEIIKIQADLHAKEASYNNHIERADNFYNAKNFPAALADYKSASLIKPAEKYPKDRIDELTALLAEAKARDDAYNKLIVLADQAFARASYPASLKNYQDALEVKPDERYPKTRIDEIGVIVKRLAQASADYEKFIAMADSFYIDKNYLKACENYRIASAVKPAESYPKEMLSKAEKMVPAQEALTAIENQYKSYLEDADKRFAEKSYDDARLLYQKALGLKPGEKYPASQMAFIDKIAADLAAAKSLDDQYAALIKSADLLFNEKSFSQAKAEYIKAQALKPEDVYPKSKIAEADRAMNALAQQKSLEERYLASIRSGDSLEAIKEYSAALIDFQNASKQKPSEQYPKTRITVINKNLADINRQKEADNQYTSAIQEGDKLFAGKKYEQARTSYQNAGRLKPDEQYPKDQIAGIASILAGLADQKALDEKYQSIVATADKLFVSKSYDLARVEYVNAAAVKPDEQYPNEKIAAIDRIFGEIAAKKLALDEQYRLAIHKGDSLMSEKTYTAAKVQYQLALKAKPAESYPTTKIAEAEAAMGELAKLKQIDDQYRALIENADKLFSEKKYLPARNVYLEATAVKSAESYPKEQIAKVDLLLQSIAKQKETDDLYNSAIASADKLLLDNLLDQARSEYVNAGNIKPAEQYPKDKIAEIDRAIGEIAAKKALEEQYKVTIASADKFLTEKSYDQAKGAYQLAGSLKPEEKYPAVKVQLIDSLLAQISRQKALEEEYSTTIINADKLLLAKSYEEAKSAYLSASILKPAEQYPKQKLVEAEKGIAELNRRKAIDEQYVTAIAGADKLLAEQSYEAAKNAYLEAGKIKPAEGYPKEKVAEITSILTAIARQKVIDGQYSAIVTKADQLLLEKNLPAAKTEYLNALKVKSEEQYPKDRIVEIDAIISEQKAINEKYGAKIAEADQLLLSKNFEAARTEYQTAGLIKPGEKYPEEKIAEINRLLTELKGKRQTFDELVANGDTELAKQDWGRAKDLYRQALTIFPEEAYPKSKIATVDAKIDSLYRANKSRYDKAIAEGDKYFNAYEFDKAVDAFTDAMALLPMEKYPGEMITKIRRTIAENAIADVLNSTVTITAGNEKQFGFTPVNMASRKNNFVYIKIRNLSGKPFNVLMRYGVDKQSNGGVVIRNLSLDGKVNERLVSVRDQDAWYREENNWISLYPQGGDVEVSFIQVSRARQD